MNNSLVVYYSHTCLYLLIASCTTPNCVQSSEFYLFRILKQHFIYNQFAKPLCLIINVINVSVYNITIILLSEQTNVKSGAEEETATKTVDSVNSSEASSSSRVCQPSDAPKSESQTKTSKPGLVNGLTSITALDEKEKIGKKKHIYWLKRCIL